MPKGHDPSTITEQQSCLADTGVQEGGNNLHHTALHLELQHPLQICFGGRPALSLGLEAWIILIQA